MVTWPASMCIFSNMVKPSCISERAGNLGLDDLRVHRPPAVDDVDQAQDPHLPGLSVDLDLGAGGAHIQNGVALGVSPVAGSGGT